MRAPISGSCTRRNPLAALDFVVALGNLLLSLLLSRQHQRGGDSHERRRKRRRRTTPSRPLSCGALILAHSSTRPCHTLAHRSHRSQNQESQQVSKSIGQCECVCVRLIKVRLRRGKNLFYPPEERRKAIELN